MLQLIASAVRLFAALASLVLNCVSDPFYVHIRERLDLQRAAVSSAVAYIPAAPVEKVEATSDAVRDSDDATPKVHIVKPGAPAATTSASSTRSGEQRRPRPAPQRYASFASRLIFAWLWPYALALYNGTYEYNTIQYCEYIDLVRKSVIAISDNCNFRMSIL